ncbi:hypothetical protein V2G26_006842 [Clonostachys chloroleuca]|uniref:Potassium transporter 5 n=1 Tax=Clonostachys chloroleuca TaxID=1926264 RepID=A0AA35M3A1_9HYPO|nr:unnamed protein product [Clonostachys chloroleuca]
MASPSSQATTTPQKQQDPSLVDLTASVGNGGERPTPADDSQAWERVDQEKARRVAVADLNRKNKQTYRGLSLLWLVFQSVGVVYGDIGTSPLYVYSSTFSAHPSRDDVIGALSIIIWSLTLIVSIKYCLIVLFADDDGHGGTFAMYSLLARHANILRRDPNSSSLLRLERHHTREMPSVGRTARNFLERSNIAKIALKIIAIVGVSLVIADGILMPAQSVLGAIQGVRVVRPDFTTSAIVGISCAIIVLLFLIQWFGTAKLGSCFAPVVIIWLLFNLSTGIYNLVQYDHGVAKAFSPYFAFSYLARNGEEGWKSLGGTLLAFTGSEALFADIGAFGRTATQISWFGLAYPCLLITYLGQAAVLAADDANGIAYTNPFFYSVPPGTFYFSLVIAILTAIVASQALITSSFQLISQLMRLSYFPHIKMVHTSHKFHYQIYIPFANFLLLIGTIIVTAVYNNTTSLGHAYGVCVIIVSFITTCMAALVALIIWRIPSYVVIPVFLIFIALDGAYLTAALQKVAAGGWFTLVLAFLLSLIFALWRWGKEKQWAAEAMDRIIPAEILDLSAHGTARQSQSSSTHGKIKFSTSFGGGELFQTPGIAIFFDKVGTVGDKVPRVFTQYLRRFKSRPQVVVLFHLRPLTQPVVPDEEKFIITRFNSQMSSCYRVTLRHGYAEDMLTSELKPRIVMELILFLTRGAPDASPADVAPSVQKELQTLNQAQAAQVLYVMGKEMMQIRKSSKRNPLRWAALEVFLWIRENSRRKLSDMNIDHDSLIEVGFVKDI